MNKEFQIAKYFLFDLLASILSWTLFFSYRKVFIEQISIEFTLKFYVGIVSIPLFWVFLYTITGSYKDIFRKSRLKEFSQTFTITLNIAFTYSATSQKEGGIH